MSVGKPAHRVQQSPSHRERTRANEGQSNAGQESGRAGSRQPEVRPPHRSRMPRARQRPRLAVLVLRLITLVTARYNWRQGILHVGQREIARLWSVDERTVKREMAKLRSLGWITVESPARRGRVASYALDLTAIRSATREAWARVGEDFDARMRGTAEIPVGGTVGALPATRAGARLGRRGGGRAAGRNLGRDAGHPPRRGPGGLRDMVRAAAELRPGRGLPRPRRAERLSRHLPAHPLRRAAGARPRKGRGGGGPARPRRRRGAGQGRGLRSPGLTSGSG